MRNEGELVSCQCNIFRWRPDLLADDWRLEFSGHAAPMQVVIGHLAVAPSAGELTCASTCCKTLGGADKNCVDPRCQSHVIFVPCSKCPPSASVISGSQRAFLNVEGRPAPGHYRRHSTLALSKPSGTPSSGADSGRILTPIGFHSKNFL